jgi:hypothetical protein
MGGDQYRAVFQSSAATSAWNEEEEDFFRHLYYKIIVTAL